MNFHRLIQKSLRKGIRFYSDILQEKTTVTILNQQSDGRLMIDSFSQVGFRLNNGLSAFGSIALFPKTVLSWKVCSSSDICKDSLSLFYMLEPKIDILVLGIGDTGSYINPEIITFMRNKKIALEILPTESACTTFNFLNDEMRYVAAALIPPTSVRAYDDDIFEMQRRHKVLFKIEDMIEKE